MANDADDAVLTDRNKHQRVVDPAMRHAVRAVLGRVGGARRGRKSGCEHKPAQRADPLQKLAPARIDKHQRCVVHDFAPCWPAACLIAARMRVYVPQRQMLPAIASSMSASVGRGFCLSSAVAVMIWPPW